MENKKIMLKTLIVFLIILYSISCKHKKDNQNIDNKNALSEIKISKDSTSSILISKKYISEKTGTQKSVQNKQIGQHIENWLESNNYKIIEKGNIPNHNSKLLRDFTKISKISTIKTIYRIKAKKTIPLIKKGNNYFANLIIEKWNFKNLEDANKVFSLLQGFKQRPFLKKPPKAFIINEKIVYCIISNAEIFREEVNKLHQELQ